MSLYKISVKIFNKILEHQIVQYIKKIMYHDQVDFIQEM
jgi:hypothetical protein